MSKSEEQTRKEIIDSKLKNAGCSINNRSHNIDNLILK